jgi:hypothetical protein
MAKPTGGKFKLHVHLMKLEKRLNVGLVIEIQVPDLTV